MEPRDIYMTKVDMSRLKELVEVGIAFKDGNKEHRHLENLEHELDRAHMVEPSAIPHDVVTMNSRVRLKNLETGQESELTLVFPSNADIEHHRISVLAPIGTAILGYRRGDTVDWPVPAGPRKVQIQEILYQPEAAGRYDE